MRRTMMTLVALLLAAAAFGATRPQPAQQGMRRPQCATCLPGYICSGPPLYECIR